MTSLEMPRSMDHIRQENPEWGTGVMREHLDPWIPRAPTWQYTGHPPEQYYSLTQLKLSNLRKDDQLIPNPQVCEIGKDLSNLEFPAEHPYSSHISRFAVFPTFDSPEDPRKGVVARNKKPLHQETPASAYDVMIKSKTKGSGLRHEIITSPPDAMKSALFWKGEDHFDQVVKYHGNRRSFYPTPQKIFAPNLQDRPIEMKLSDASADTLRNIERSHWLTTNSLDFTGLGPSNPLKLENIQDKRVRFLDTGMEDDTLHAHTQNEFYPARPMEGRLARLLTPLPAHQKMIDSGTPSDPNYQRKMTSSEKEEYRLLNGHAYKNYPADSDPEESNRWREIDQTSKPEQNRHDTEYNPNNEISPFPLVMEEEEEESYLKRMKREQEEEIQQMEATNRWKLLESQKPEHDITLLNVKYQHARESDKPATFYMHEGKYNEERAGLYKTSYNPERLTHSMNSLRTSGPEIMNTLHSHVGAETLPTTLSRQVKDALMYSQTASIQEHHTGGRPTDLEVLQPYNQNKEAQRIYLQPTQDNAHPFLQEGEFLQRSSTMGDSYNVRKFLQENSLPRHARIEPLHVMSLENKQLRNVRSRSLPRSPKSVQFSDKVTIATVFPDQPVRPATDRPGGSVDRSSRCDVPFQQRIEKPGHGQHIPRHRVTFHAEIDPLKEMMSSLQDISVPDRSFMRRPVAGEVSEYNDEFRSSSSNFMPTNMKNSMSFKTSYANQFPKFNLQFKDDSRFSWEPGCGTPRPQTSLLEMQDRFSRSGVRSSFHSSFRENAPDLRLNTSRGKKHSFGGFNCQVLHG